MCAIIVGCACVRMVWQATSGTPLLVASQKGHVEVVKALVGAGAAVNQATVRDRDEWGDCWCSGERGLLVFVLNAACVCSFTCLCVHVSVCGVCVAFGTEVESCVGR